MLVFGKHPFLVWFFAKNIEFIEENVSEFEGKRFDV